MGYKILKPLNDLQRLEFIAKYNNSMGLNIEEDKFALYALENNEMVKNGEIVINPDYEKETAEELEEVFLNEFFEIPNVNNFFEGGWFRRIPKGYSSAIESLNTIFNTVTVTKKLPEGYLMFYKKPDFTIKEQRTQEWLIENSFRNKDMTLEQFAEFYTAFVLAWNKQEHE